MRPQVAEAEVKNRVAYRKEKKREEQNLKVFLRFYQELISLISEELGDWLLGNWEEATASLKMWELVSTIFNIKWEGSVGKVL